MASLGHGLLAIACAGPGEIRMRTGTGFFGGDSVLKIDFFALSVFFCFFCGFGCADQGRPVLLCATGMEHGRGRGRGGGESLIFDPGRVLMKRRHSACTQRRNLRKRKRQPPSRP